MCKHRKLGCFQQWFLWEYMTHHAVARVKCATRVITRDFLRFQKTDFHFIYFSVSGNPGHTYRICKLRAQKQCGVVSSKPWLERKNGLLKYYLYYLYTQVICENVLPCLLRYAYQYGKRKDNITLAVFLEITSGPMVVRAYDVGLLSCHRFPVSPVSSIHSFV